MTNSHASNSTETPSAAPIPEDARAARCAGVERHYNAGLGLSIVSGDDLFFGGDGVSNPIHLVARFTFAGRDFTPDSVPQEIDLWALASERPALHWSEPHTLRGFLFHLWGQRSFIPAYEYVSLQDGRGLWTECLRARLVLEDFQLLSEADGAAFSLAADPEIFVFEPWQQWRLGELWRFASSAAKPVSPKD